MTIIISKNGEDAKRIEKSPIEKEDFLQNYIHKNPESVPLYEIKEDIQLLILAREFPTNSGPIDALGIDKDGEIYIVETKLYANADKRRVIAQSLDYGAALWKHANDFSDFTHTLNEHTKKAFNLSASEKISSFFKLDSEEIELLFEKLRINLNNGTFHFVVVMDKTEDRLKDLILYVNQNSQFNVYAVELEYYKYEDQEIIIPRLFGGEVKKSINKSKDNTIQWNWSLFQERLRKTGELEVQIAEKIINWSENNDIEVSWGKSQTGSFILCMYKKGEKRGFYPFSITGNGEITWNAPHQADYSPYPFNDIEKRRDLLKRLQSLDGSIVDIENVNGYNGFSLPLNKLQSNEMLDNFYSICLWVQEEMNTREQS